MCELRHWFVVGFYVVVSTSALWARADDNSRADRTTDVVPNNDVPTELAVVKTWAELLKQPPIEVADGVSVRLGIEKKTWPRWSGVLVYCYCDRLPKRSLESDSRASLGPVRIQLRAKRPDERAIAVRLSASARLPHGKLLFVRSLTNHKVGDYQLRITTLGGTVIGTSTVSVTDGPFHPWMPFDPSPRVGELAKRREDSAPVSFVANRGVGIAAPRGSGMEALVFEGRIGDRKIKRHTDERLPQLFPAKADPSFRVRIEGRTLAASCREAIISTRAEDQILTRWWVNGEPFYPKPISEFTAADRTGQISFDKRLDLKLHFDAAKIGAKPGDEVRLQLLFCPSGWSWLGPDFETLHTALPHGAYRGSLLSNRVTFIVSDP